MSIPEHYRGLAEQHKEEALASLAELEKFRGTLFTEQQKENLWEQGLWRLALMRSGQRLPVPERITVELVTAIPPAELTQLLWDYLCVFTEDAGGNRKGGPYRDTILALPRGLRLVHTLVVLDSEVRNGGFYQFFTNSSGGELVNETLEDLQFIGAEKQAALLQEAIALNKKLEAKYPFYRNRFQEPEPEADSECEAVFWSDVEQNFKPGFDRLDTDFYAIEDSESLWRAFDLYARHHLGEFVHSRIES